MSNEKHEPAEKQPVTDCNHLGNEAKMRKALVKSDAAFRRISQSAWFIDANFHEIMSLNKVMTAADAAIAKAGGAK